eukprot:TRINITY_DN7398_c0_g1_i2.p1 TRINITY_DN7398_c0_g1~~TRINITY_DN7398_c0_g1_i2.p1  ORF type:complete len:523 (+),score=127.99 TRINITY_DN7398_c0_g1_i2:78-1646(+)
MSWTRPSVTGSAPSARCAHTISVTGQDEISTAKLFVFGGWNGTRMLNDLHIFYCDSMTWNRPITTGAVPGFRAGHTSTAIGTQLFVFGGGDGSHYLNDLHILDSETMAWSQAYVAGTSPAARSRHTATLIGSKIFIFGGGDDSRVFNDTYIFDTGTMAWSRPIIKGEPPVARWGHTATLAEDGKIILFGGHDGTQMLNDVHVLDTTQLSWSSINVKYEMEPPTILSNSSPMSPPASHASNLTSGVTPTGPSARAGHTSTYLGKNRILVFGGGDGSKILNDCWFLDLTDAPAWTRPQISGTAPPGRCAHTSEFIDQKIIVFGGGDGSRRFKDLYTLDIDQLMKLEEKKLKNAKKQIKQKKAPSLLVKNPEEIKAKDITQWLTSLGMKKHAEKFVAEEIDLETLPHLTESHLEHLGITTIGSRLRIMNAIRTQNPSPPSPSPIPSDLIDAIKSLKSSVEILSSSTQQLSETLRQAHGVDRNSQLEPQLGRRSSGKIVGTSGDEEYLGDSRPKAMDKNVLANGHL